MNVNEAKKALNTEVKEGLTVKITVDDTQLEAAMEKAKQLYACLKETEEIIRTLYKGMDQITVYMPSISARSFCDGLIAELTEDRRKAEQNRNHTNTLKLLLEVNL